MTRPPDGNRGPARQAAVDTAWQVMALADCLNIVFDATDEKQDNDGPIQCLIQLMQEKSGDVFQYLSDQKR